MNSIQYLFNGIFLPQTIIVLACLQWTIAFYMISDQGSDEICYRKYHVEPPSILPIDDTGLHAYLYTLIFKLLSQLIFFYVWLFILFKILILIYKSISYILIFIVINQIIIKYIIIFKIFKIRRMINDNIKSQDENNLNIEGVCS
jgi:hypothetical protein